MSHYCCCKISNPWIALQGDVEGGITGEDDQATQAGLGNGAAITVYDTQSIDSESFSPAECEAFIQTRNMLISERRCDENLISDRELIITVMNCKLKAEGMTISTDMLKSGLTCFHSM